LINGLKKTQAEKTAAQKQIVLRTH